VNQPEVDDAAVALFPELKRLVALRESGAWKLAVEVDEHGAPQLVTGALTHVDGSRDILGVRSQSEVRAIRLNPVGELVFRREGSLVEVVDALLELPSPLHPRAPRLVLSAPPRLWVPGAGA
jgi:hypothetical protein